MPEGLTVIVGGQYGSEGKGKLAAHLASTLPGPVHSVRSGGSNSGHTAYRAGHEHKLRQLPCGAVTNDARLYLAAGMVVDLPVLQREMHALAIDPRRLMIDRNAVVMSSKDADRERVEGLGDRVGSTLSGTGAAIARKVMRDPTLCRAADERSLAHVVGDVSGALNRALDRREHVVVEGTQGFGLSLHHTDHWPYATGRDTTAAAYLSDCGLSPMLATDVILVLRTFPIRVAGNSGPMWDEISWEDVARESGRSEPIAEHTTVTGRLRRVGRFDWDLARRAVQANRPTLLALHGADYLDHRDYGQTRWSDLRAATRHFVIALESRLGVPVGYVFTGGNSHQIIERISRQRHHAKGQADGG